MGAGAAFKTAAGRSGRVVSALRHHVHYVVNYVFEGHRAGDPRGDVVVRCLWEDHRKAHNPDSKYPPTTSINGVPLKATLRH